MIKSSLLGVFLRIFYSSSLDILKVLEFYLAKHQFSGRGGIGQLPGVNGGSGGRRK